MPRGAESWFIMYNPESIKKYLAKMTDAIKRYDVIPAAELTVSVSKGNRKIGRVMNVSIPPIITCANCKECKYLCYDIKANLQYLNVVNSRAKNYSILIRDREQYFSQIESAISRRRTNKFFRWHVAGDILDINYFSHMVEIARRHSDFVFWTYTKNYAIVNAYCDKYGRAAIPGNLHIMFSEWRGLKMVNPYHFPEFRVVFKTDAVRPTGHYCPGNCDICKANCRGCLAGETTYCNEH